MVIMKRARNMILIIILMFITSPGSNASQRQMREAISKEKKYLKVKECHTYADMRNNVKFHYRKR